MANKLMDPTLRVGDEQSSGLLNKNIVTEEKKIAQQR